MSEMKTEESVTCSKTATGTWRGLISQLMVTGDTVVQDARAHEPRSRTTRELVGCQTRWPMSRPIVLCPQRKIGRKFAAAEAAWILSGSNKLDEVAKYATYLRNFSDDSRHLSGAYGPPFVDQLPYVTGCLAKDPQSRQAVATLWRPRPGPSRDVPCTVALQWLVRDEAICCVATMRSSDAWLGVPYDVISFSCMSAAVGIEVNRLRPGTVRHLGELVFTAGSQHLYALDFDAAKRCLADDYVPEVGPGFSFAEFTSVDDLIVHLRSLINRLDGVIPACWLLELAHQS